MALFCLVFITNNKNTRNNLKKKKFNFRKHEMHIHK